MQIYVDTREKARVLIETLWNVKAILAVLGAILACGFNRNIVECKGEIMTLDRSNIVGFNRNIVECKENL